MCCATSGGGGGAGLAIRVPLGVLTGIVRNFNYGLYSYSTGYLLES